MFSLPIHSVTLVCLTLLKFRASEAYSTPFVDIGPQNEKEDFVYLYKSIADSQAEYQAAKHLAQRGFLGRGDDHICYDGHGCYYKNDTYSNFWALPDSPEYINTVFYLYTEAEQTNPQVISYSDPKTITGSRFKKDKPTTIFIHGFGDSVKTAWMPQIQKAVFHGVSICGVAATRRNGCIIFADNWETWMNKLQNWFEYVWPSHFFAKVNVLRTVTAVSLS